MKKYCTIYLVRHGETIANVKKILNGHQDYPLTNEGEKQARDLARKLNHLHFDAIFASDLGRAKRTAELITLKKKITVQTTKLLRERSFGRHEGKPWEYQDEELKRMWYLYERLSNKEKFQFRFRPESESDEELAIRMITVLREIAVAYSGKTVLVVSHGGIMRAFLIKLDYADVSLGFNRLIIKNTAYVKLLTDGDDFFIKQTEGIDKLDDR